MMHHTLLKIAPAVALIALASCGARDQPAKQPQGGRPVENATLTKISLTSDAFQNGQAIPAQYTCDGADQSPALKWSEPPQETKGFALIVDDPDAPGGTYHHWGAYNIPANLRSLPAGAGNSQGGAFAQALNDFGKPGYGGPCPPKGHGPHHYRFKLYALDVDSLDVGPSPNIPRVEAQAASHVLGRAELTGTYERK